MRLFFFETPSFDTSTTCKKKSRTPTHYLCVFRYGPPPKHYKTGESRPNNFGQIFDSTLAKFLSQKRPNLGQILTLQHIYIYIMYMRLRVHTWAHPCQSKSTIVAGASLHSLFAAEPRTLKVLWANKWAKVRINTRAQYEAFLWYSGPPIDPIRGPLIDL